MLARHLQTGKDEIHSSYSKRWDKPEREGEVAPRNLQRIVCSARAASRPGERRDVRLIQTI
jgi:hypothetical protein